MEDAGGKSLACIVDIRDEEQIAQSIEETVKKFGGIDILINNASAISLTGTEVTKYPGYILPCKNSILHFEIGYSNEKV